MRRTFDWRKTAAVLGLALSVSWLIGADPAQAQPQPPQKGSKPNNSNKLKDSLYPAVVAGAGYRFGPVPAWVQPVPAAVGSSAASLAATQSGLAQTLGNIPGLPADAFGKFPAARTGSGADASSVGARARRDRLVDVQIQLQAKDTHSFFRLHTQALDSSTLREVSEPQVSFNPAYQTLVIHSVSVLREGQRSDRLKSARIEIMRREQQLEQQMIDGVRTALVVLNDVRVGDVVEMAYTVEGENPIYEHRFSTLLQLAADTPIDQLHLRVQAPLSRKLYSRGIGIGLGGETQPERFEEGGQQVLRVLRTQVAPVLSEAGTPPWFKVYPALQISEYASWAELDQWAQGLFTPEATGTPAGVKLAEQVAALRALGLPPEQTVAAALRFVQDEVRYFSASLGESSHRPKPASRTLSERLGDCKDKVMLLNALLSGLGFEARPTLVSMARNRGLANYLPAHDQFDHVISRVQLGEQVFFLDPTIANQGLSLQSRGYYPYGLGLVVGGAKPGSEVALQTVMPPSFAEDSLSYRQDWDLHDLRQVPQLKTRLIAKGLAAERWRAGFANAGVDRIAQALAGAYLRQQPGLETVGQPELLDDRQSNQLELRMSFQNPGLGVYSRGGLELELPAAEMADLLLVPPEAKRRMPFMLEQTRVVDRQLVLLAPRAFVGQPPPVQQVGDKHFNLSTRLDLQDNKVTVASKFERRSDEVLPVDLEAFRERVAKARQITGNRLRLNLLDTKALQDQFTDSDRWLAKYRKGQPDALFQILQQNEINRVAATSVLPKLDPKSRWAAQLLVELAQANNHLGYFEHALSDAQSAIDSPAAGPNELGGAWEARGVALVGLGRPGEALQAFQTRATLPDASSAGNWLASTHYLLGDYAQAEQALRQSLGNSNGAEREFSLLWLYFAVEQQGGGKGRAAIAPELAGVDAGKWPGAVLHYLNGGLDRDALLRLARERPDQERLRLAEAYFYIGQQLAAQGKRAEAKPWFERTLDTQALPYREFTLAQWELKRAGRP